MHARPPHTRTEFDLAITGSSLSIAAKSARALGMSLVNTANCTSSGTAAMSARSVCCSSRSSGSSTWNSRGPDDNEDDDDDDDATDDNDDGGGGGDGGSDDESDHDDVPCCRLRSSGRGRGRRPRVTIAASEPLLRSAAVAPLPSRLLLALLLLLFSSSSRWS
jgi:hypothetical protein